MSICQHVRSHGSMDHTSHSSYKRLVKILTCSGAGFQGQGGVPGGEWLSYAGLATRIDTEETDYLGLDLGN